MNMVGVPQSSFFKLSALEVRNLAIQSIAEIEADRARKVRAAIDEVENEECVHLFGLFRHPLYRTRKDAEERSPEAHIARMYARGDMITCKLLLKAAEHLLALPIPDEEKYLNVSLNDFRALT